MHTSHHTTKKMHKKSQSRNNLLKPQDKQEANAVFSIASETASAKHLQPIHARETWEKGEQKEPKEKSARHRIADPKLSLRSNSIVPRNRP